MWKAKVTSKGQITIPQELRYKIGLERGDTLEIKETPHGYVIRKAVEPEKLRKYIGCAGKNNLSSDEVVKELRGGDV